MLLFGTHKTMPMDDNITSIGFLTLKEGLYKINLQFPLDVASAEETQFDILFGQYMMENDIAFIELMTLMYALYEGRNIYITINDSIEYIGVIAESLGKFIQQRYGYNYAMINNYEDYNYLDETSFSFSTNGLFNFDIDKDKYTKLIAFRYPNLVFQQGVDNYGNSYKYIPEGFLYNPKY